MSSAPPPHVPGKRPAYEPGARLLSPVRYDPDMPRPATTVAGTFLVLLRAIAGAFVLLELAREWDSLFGTVTASDAALNDPEVRSLLLGVVLVGGGILVLADAVLGILIYRGHNWPRVLVMLFSVISISTVFTAWWVRGEEITLDGTFLSLSLDILLLLALSSRSAAAYARRNERRPEND
ncbi:hypothetical protein [Microbacterium sp. NPDC077184]|uniref:hypothetical protein n=1 Tax=Microbacterium sp. NPDC077184 TaxID=3154764 RepID=UPI00341422B6